MDKHEVVAAGPAANLAWHMLALHDYALHTAELISALTLHMTVGMGEEDVA